MMRNIRQGEKISKKLISTIKISPWINKKKRDDQFPSWKIVKRKESNQTDRFKRSKSSEIEKIGRDDQCQRRQTFRREMVTRINSFAWLESFRMKQVRWGGHSYRLKRPKAEVHSHQPVPMIEVVFKWEDRSRWIFFIDWICSERRNQARRARAVHQIHSQTRKFIEMIVVIDGGRSAKRNWVECNDSDDQNRFKSDPAISTIIFIDPRYFGERYRVGWISSDE